ncbi:MAG: TonB-dependent siderophore receptor [Candidatus Rokubacteria bacterium]|nr:TonB-dependent siderophore receptor [Candidatus Rokubacteria bacterium]
MSGKTLVSIGTSVATFAALTLTLPIASAQDARQPLPLPEMKVDAPFSRPAVPERASTGTKTDTPLLDVPATIQVVPKEVFVEQGQHTLDAVTRNVSSVNLAAQSAYGFFNNFLIRGLSQQFLRDGLVDGPAINGYVRTLSDVERVEILKGPGSALYGSGQPGGTVNLISKMPTATPYYAVYGSGGSFGTYGFGTDFGGPLLSDILGYRFNTADYHTDGFRGVGATIREVLPLLQWKLDPENTLTVKLDYRDVEAVADTVGIPFRGRTIIGVPLDTKLYTPFADTEQSIYRLALRLESRLGENLLLRNEFAVLHRDLDLLRNAANPAFAANGITLTGRNLRDQTDHATDWVYHIEPVWTVPTGPLIHTLLGGFEYQLHLLDTRRSTAALANIPDAFHPVIPEQSRAGLVFVRNFDRHSEGADYALYAQDQMTLTEQWKVRAGVRADRFDSEDFDRVNRPRRSRTDDELSWNAGVVYQPVKIASFYAGVARSFFSNITSEAVQGAALVPERGTQYEIGAKSLWLDGRVSLNAALFHTTRENFLVAVGPDQIPIGEQKTQGFELDLASEPVPGLKLYANYAYQDSELVRLSPTDPSQGKGHQAVGVPLHAAGVWTTYELQSGVLRGLGGGGGVVFKDGVVVDTLNTQRLPPFAVLGLVGFYHTTHVDYQVNVNNVADTTYYVTARNGAGAPGDPLSVLGRVVVRY